jgi:site-specific DNA-cytosine methylase
MNVLIAYESSGTVRQAFLNRGHNAWSCDLQRADDRSLKHIRMDARKVMEHRKVWAYHWDLIIMHPPCTALCVSGNAHYGTGKPKHDQRLEAIDYTLEMFELAKSVARFVCMENPVGVLPVKASQYVQPYEYGHPESKKTGLWLHNLPRLEPTDILLKPDCGHWDNQTPSGQNKLGPSENRWKIRSKTYQGIADAMAQQWSNL